MKKKTVSGIALTLILTSMLTFALNIQPVEASGTIYIRADGSVDPPTANISSIDNITYAFTDNIYDSIVVERDNTVVDGAGYTLQGTGTGIDLSAYNVTIKNIEVRKFDWGIMSYYDNHTIFGNTLTNNGIGIEFLGSGRNTIYGNHLDNGNDIRFHNSGATIYENNITGGGITMLLFSVATIYGNNIVNGAGIGVYDDSVATIYGNNIVNGGGVRFFNSGGTVSGNNITGGGGVRLVWSSGYNIIGNNITGNTGDGIYLEGCFTGNVFGNSIKYNLNGIRTGVFWLSEDEKWGTWNNNITGNIIEENSQYGIQLTNSSNNFIYHNSFLNNTDQVYSEYSVNIWDDDYSSGGNYWSNYTGVDSGHDGIGDTPYVIDEDNQDSYPLMNPWTELSDLGDCDGDYDVDYDDFITLRDAYGTSVGEPGYHARADFDKDGDVDYDDFIILAGNYGKTL